MSGETCSQMQGSVVAAGLIIIAIIAIAALGIGFTLYPMTTVYTFDFSAQESVNKFSSCEELEAFLEEKSESASYGTFASGLGAPMAMQRSMELGAVMAPSAGDLESSGAAQKADDYSTTNIQVEGVDEADIVKSDGKYLYIIAGGKLVIVDAYPAEEAQILSETNITGNPTELFINDDKLVLFTYGGYHIVPYEDGGSYKVQGSGVLVYNVSDRANPELTRNMTVEGNYYDSRMIGNYVYIISQKYVNTWAEPGIPRITHATVGQVIEEVEVDAKPACNCGEVYYFDVPDSSYQFTTITSLNMKDDVAEPQSKVFLMGYSQNMFVSLNNIYITYQNRIDYTTLAEKALDEVVMPTLPSEVVENITRVRNNEDLRDYEKMNVIGRMVNDYVQSLGPEEGATFMKTMETRLQDFYIKISKELERSVVHRIAIKNGNIEYATSGTFPGRVINQFSMDEDNGYFRVATTTTGWGMGRSIEPLNHVYILDSNLNIVGKLENLASGETIRSARFMFDRLYLVTFERIDPFFVIDLSNPFNPIVLGELKIPGYSEYLHPYDNNHIIGVGVETEENEWGGISNIGVKLSLFDVTDVSNPKEVSKYVIEGRGVYSLALYEHKAFLFDRNKELLVIPVRAPEEIQDNGNMPWRNYWHGAYVFQVNLDDGIKYRGKISHQADLNETEQWFNYQYDVKRSMYMDDVLYTLSDRILKMNSLINLDDINEVELPYRVYVYGKFGGFEETPPLPPGF